MPRIFDFGGREVERSSNRRRPAGAQGKRPARYANDGGNRRGSRGGGGGRHRDGCLPRRQCARGPPGSHPAFRDSSDRIYPGRDRRRHAARGFRRGCQGADAVITARGYEMVRMLAAESIPVVGHVGFVPRKSTWVGSVRAVGKTAAEALDLWDRFRRLEDAGAFAVECELVTADVLSEINGCTSLVTISLGSGGDADVIFLFASDICGEKAKQPRHARAWGDLADCTGLCAKSE